MPLNPTHLRDTQFVKDSLGTEVVQEESVIGADEDFPKGSWEDVLDLGEAFLDDGPLARIASIKAAHEHLTCVAVKRADAILADEAAAERVFTTFLKGASGLIQILVEGKEDELTALDIEIENEVVAALIEAVVVDARGLVKEHLLASGLNRRHHLLILCGQVVHV